MAARRSDTDRSSRTPVHRRRAKKAPATKPAGRKAEGEEPKDDAAPAWVDDAPPARVRLQKLLASAGFGSRRACEDLIDQGRVTINGETAKLGDSATLGQDDVRYDGEKLVGDKPVYWMVNKPEGVITSVRDPDGRPTILSLMPKKSPRMFPVGRLDLGTSGLVLLTNDGDMTQRLLHPSLGNEREYRVTVKGCVPEKAFLRLRNGIALEDGKTGKTEVTHIRIDQKTEVTTFYLTLKEGRKRQIRRSMLILKHPVKKLVRVRMGPVKLGRLKKGDVRPLRAEEIRELKKHVAKLRPTSKKRTTRPKRKSYPPK
ncbi:MAG: 23S rRNA pseudouridine2605 synthase [Myxococcota bacterium]|jgi:23S rRNA pseudouridine2605 synthase